MVKEQLRLAGLRVTAARIAVLEALTAAPHSSADAVAEMARSRLGSVSTTGNADATITSGLEGAWTTAPARWDNNFFDNLFGYEWELAASPAGAHHWRPTDRAADQTVPDAHDSSKGHAPMMLTTDLSLRIDPLYEPVSRRFHENPDEFADAFMVLGAWELLRWPGQ